MNDIRPQNNGITVRFMSSRWHWLIVIIGPILFIGAIWATEFIILLLPCWLAAVLTAIVAHFILLLFRVSEDKRWKISIWSMLISFVIYSAVILYSLYNDIGIIEAIKFQLDQMWLHAEGI